MIINIADHKFFCYCMRVVSYQPFSHRLGVFCLIPYTAYAAEVFPTQALIYHVHDLKQPIKSILFPEPILEEFTVTQDLKKGVVTCSSQQIRYHILPCLTLLKQKKAPYCTTAKEMLHLGSSKQQNMEQLRYKKDWLTLFPLWWHITHGYSYSREGSGGIFTLLYQIESAIKQCDKTKIIPLFEKLFLAGFKDSFVPRLIDDSHQGILDYPTQGDPLSLLGWSHTLIQQLFLQQHQDTLFILPLVPKVFASGACIQWNIPSGSCDIVWSQNRIKTVCITLKNPHNIQLKFPSYVRSVRVTTATDTKGAIYPASFTSYLQAGTYIFDRFEK